MTIKIGAGIELFDFNDYGAWCSFKICHKGIVYSTSYEKYRNKSILNTSAPKEVCDRVKEYLDELKNRKKDEAAE